LRITVAGLTEAVESLEDIAERMRDMTPAMEAGAQEIEKLVSDAFRSQRAPDGEQWIQLSDTTKKLRFMRRKGNRALMRKPRGRSGAGRAVAIVGHLGSMKTLIDTSRLRDRVSTKFGARSINAGTDVVYAATHQLGRPDNKMFGGKTTHPIPARPFLPFERGGGKWSFMSSGPAADAWRVLREYIRSYVLTGEPSAE
jgi:phage gpG-like protein